MKLRPQFPPAKSSQTLIMTLAVVVVVTIAIAATLTLIQLDSRSTKNSSEETQSSLFAVNAVDLIEGDLKQEIYAGSTIIPASTTYQIYNPISPTNMLVVRNISSAAQASIPNLIRCSYTSDPISSPGVSSMASPVNSVKDPSFDGRIVNSAFWNAHYLIPRLNAGSTVPPTSVDSTPIKDFSPPDWVYVNGTGSRQILAGPNKSIVGRYAYAIYDEGALLDANVVGVPSGMTASQKGLKNSTAFADLTQLSSSLTPAVIDNLVGWRNHYTVGPTGTGSSAFPSFSVNSSGVSNYYSYLNTATNGFLIVNPAPAKATVTDQSFSSRQSLISYFRSAGVTVDALQFLGTRSRDLNQPSYIPNPNRPTVLSPGSKVGGSWNPTTYRGGNDGYQGDNTINPPILSIAVTPKTGFTRNDGTLAVYGEPLVKKRFDLRRLAWLTYKGPSANRTPYTDADMAQVLANGVTTSFLQQGTPANIYNYFGLTWTTNPTTNVQYWTYAHGAPNNRIGTLADVQTLNREADFFELLKAAISVGSLGKSAAYGYGVVTGTGTTIDTGFYQHQIDISVDNQIIQIGANMVDQSDADGYPTDISFNGLDIYGVENLPFLYRTTYSWAYKTKPVPLLTVAQKQLMTDTTPTSLSNGGEADFYIIPHIWNMCDQNDITVRGANYALGTPRPGAGQIRITATSAPPGAVNPILWTSGFTTVGINDLTTYFNINLSNTSATVFPYVNAVCNSPAPTLNSLSGASLTFGDNNGALFREPTMLWKMNYPAGSGLTTNQSNATQVTDLFDTTTHTGFFLNYAPLEWTFTDNGKSFITQASGMYFNYAQPSGCIYGNSGAVTYLSQFLNASGNWQTYDQRYWDDQSREPDNGTKATGNKALSADYDSFGTAHYQAVQYMYLFPGTPFNPDTSGQYEGDDTIGFDCRSDRWGFGEGNASSLTTLDYSLASIQCCVNPTDRPGVTASNDLNAISACHVLPWEPGGACSGTYNALFYDTPNYNWSHAPVNTGQWGMWSQNSPWVLSTSPYHLFNADADGVVRRATGAYVSPTAAATATAGLPLVTATTFTAGVGTANPAQSQSRPIILNRPFQTVNELSYVFRGSPYKNLDFSTPESGDSALLDVFCVGDVSSTNGLEAGRVNLNTRQIPVLKALLSNADIDDPAYATPFTPAEVSNLATSLYSRTSNTTSPWLGPLTNISDLVGKYVGLNVPTTVATSPQIAAAGGTSYYACNIESAGKAWGASGNTICYSGFSSDLDSDFVSASTPVIERRRESAIRALTSGGQVRVWNLLIDIDAQTGVFPPSAATAADFTVQGESHYWVHVAIDRYTGQVIDSQFELVQQ